MSMRKKRELMCIDVKLVFVFLCRRKYMMKQRGKMYIKRTKYGKHTQGIHFVPMVVDTVGAWGTSSLPVFTMLSKLWKQRFAESQGNVYARMTAPVMHRVANMLMQAVVLEEETPTLRGVEEDM